MLNPVLFPLQDGVIATCFSSFCTPTNCKSAFTLMVSLSVVLNWKNYFSAQAVALNSKNLGSFAFVCASKLIYDAFPCSCQVASTKRCGGTTISLFAPSSWPSSTRISIKLAYVLTVPYILHVQIFPRGLPLLLLVICGSFFTPLLFWLFRYLCVNLHWEKGHWKNTENIHLLLKGWTQREIP